MDGANLLRYANRLRYDAVRGVVAVRDWRVDAAPAWAEFSSVESLARELAAGLADDGAAYLAGYGLALAAHEWASRPTEPRRAALIQAAEWLRQSRPLDRRVGTFLDAALALADSALLSGGDAEAAIVAHTAATLSRADRVAERCGRIAAGLLDDGDELLTLGNASTALGWSFAAARAEDKQLRLILVADAVPANAPLWMEHIATRLQVAVQRRAPTDGVAGTLCLLTAEHIAMDGSAVVAAGGSALAAQARSAGLPCYLVTLDGPDPAIATSAAFGAADTIVLPAQISAIITHRGIYRPDMVTRFLGEGDAPLDVIPLT